MIAPAARAALMATFNMGWILDDITVCKSFGGVR